MGDFIIFLWKRRWFLVLNFAVISALGIVAAFCLAKMEYKAQITFLPSSEGTSSALSLMGISMPSLTGESILNEQIGIVFGSNSIKRQILEKFDFYRFFKIEKNPAKFELATKWLPKYVSFTSAVKGNLGFEKTLGYTITCYHRSPDTAKMLCDYSYSLLDSAVKSISMFRAHRNRVFIEGQLLQHRTRLDSLQSVFGAFQLSHKAFIVPEQFKLALKNYAEIKSAAIANEMKMQALQNDFQGSVPEINELQQYQNVFNKKLSQIESSSSPDVLPSLNESAQLLPQYTNLMRDIEVEEQVILLFAKELETARIQEARNISPLVVIDNPFVPTHKARPKRLLILALFIGSENFFLLLLYLFQFLCTSTLLEKKNVRDFLGRLQNS